MNIDLSFSKAAVVLPKEHKRVSFYIIGAGGTGSFAAMAIARLGFELKKAGKDVGITVIDPERVERGNIPRSNFCFAEVGFFKAQALSERLSAAWGLEVGYFNEKFDFEKHLAGIARNYKQITILVGCVDNFEARREIHRAVGELERYSSSQAPNIWWIDGGNGRTSGQVLIGSNTLKHRNIEYFTAPSICRKLPAPSVLHPDLLEPEAKILKRDDTENLSCPDRIRLGEQSLNINSRVAVEIGEMLTELLLTGSLRRFATYFDLTSGTSRSLYCTPETIQKALSESSKQRRKSKSTR